MPIDEASGQSYKRRRGGRDVQKPTAQDSLGQGRRVTRRPCRFMGGELV